MAVSLFSNGAKGFLYDPSALTGAKGDPVTVLADLSGNGNNMAQSVLARAPKLGESGGKKWLAFDGMDDAMSCAAVNLSGATKLTLLMGIRYYGASLGIPLEYGTPSVTSGFGAYFNNGGAALGTGFGSSAGVYSFANAPTGTEGQAAVLAVTFDTTGSILSEIQDLRLNGENVAEINAATTGVPAAALFGNSALYLGARTASQYFAKCDVFGIIGIARKLTSAEMADAEGWLGARMPPVPPAMNKARKHFDLIGSLTRSDLSTHVDGDAFSYVEFTTEAATIEVESYSNMVGLFPALADIGVTLDGEFLRSIRHPANGTLKTTVALPAGEKVVRFVNGSQARASGATGQPWCGTWVKAFTADAPLRTTPSGDCLFVYGDSIATGAWAADTQSDAWIPLVREALGIRVAAKAIGSQTLWDDCNTPALAKDFADRIARIAPTKIWLAIGTNDFGLGRWSAAAFGAAYGNLLDAMRELMPWAEVYAQTPLLRTEVGVQAYRDAIAAACSVRPWVTLVNGTAIMPLERLPDGLHPDTEGHQLYTDYVLNMMGSL